MPLKFNKLESNIVFYFNPTVGPIEVGIRLMGAETVMVIVEGGQDCIDHRGPQVGPIGCLSAS